MPSNNSDSSNGWEAIADDFLAIQSALTGAVTIKAWSDSFEAGQSILDIGCGFGGSYTQDLIDKGIEVFGIDASSALLQEYLQRYPEAQVRCEAAETSTYFDRKFDGILSIGLIFLLSQQAQKIVLQKMGAALDKAGKLLITAPHQVCDWNDLLTGRKSQSLGKTAYAQMLEQYGIHLVDEYTDEGENHYFDFEKS